MSYRERRVPEVRFRGYSDDWEQRKLIDVTKVITKGTTPKDKSSEGDINFIKVENIDSVSGAFSISVTSKISKEEHEGYLKRSQLELGDILFSIAGTLGRVTIVNDDVLPANTNQALAIIRLHEGNVDFIATYLKGKSVEDYIRKNPTVGAQPNLSLQQVGNLTINYPKNREQESIGAFFKQLDYTIALHQRKLDKLKQLKKSYLQLMFPQKGEDVPGLRFANFDHRWEQRKLGDLANFSKGRGYTKNDLTEKGHPIILYGRLYTKYETVIETVDTFVLKKENSILSIGNEVIVPSSGEVSEDIARASVVCKPGIILGGDLNIIRLHNELDPVFLVLTISNGEQQKELSKRAQGKSIVHIHNSDLKEVNLLFPTRVEQTKIGKFFNKLEDTIALHQTKLDKLQSIKKAFLQKMFI